MSGGVCGNQWRMMGGLCGDHLQHKSDEVAPFCFPESKLCEILRKGQVVQWIYVRHKPLNIRHSDVEKSFKKIGKSCANTCKLQFESFDPLQTKILFAKDAKGRIHPVPSEAIVAFFP